MYDHNYFSELPHEEKANLIQTAQWGSGRWGSTPHRSPSNPQSKSPQGAAGPNRNTATLECCVKPETYPHATLGKHKKMEILFRKFSLKGIKKL